MFKSDKLTPVVPFCYENDLEMLQCKFCDFQSHLKVTLSKHVNYFHRNIYFQHLSKPLKPYNCSKCNQTTYSLLIHFLHRRHNCEFLRKQQECPHCCYKSTHPSNFKRHLETHGISRRSFPCDSCHHISHTRANLQKHMQSKHTFCADSIWYECEDPKCSFVAKELHIARKHQLLNHGAAENIPWFYCAHCPHKSKYKGALQAHIFAKHKKNEVKKLQCKVCSLKIGSKWNLNRHMTLKHDRNVQWFYCVKCDYKAKDEKYVKVHLLSKHKCKYV